MSTACFLPYIGLGSCLLHMSYVHAFAKKEGPITILTFSNSLVDALKDDKNIKEVIVVKQFHKKLFDILKLSKFLKTLSLKKLYIFKCSLRFYYAGKLAGIYTKSYPFYKKINLHLVKEAQKFTAKHLKLQNCPSETKLEINHAAANEIKKIIPANKKKILIAPSSSGPTTMWNVSSFIELMKKLDVEFDCFFIIAVDSSVREKKIADEITKSFDKNKIMSLSDRTINQIMPIISYCNVAICNDTSFQHLSCQLNVPTLILRFDTPDAYSSYSKLQYSILPEGHAKIDHDTKADTNLIKIDNVFSKTLEIIN